MGQGRERSRHFEWSALMAVIPALALVPVWLLALAVVWFPVHLVFDNVEYWMFPVAWLLLGVLLFIPTAEAWIVAPVLGARRATYDELDVIVPVWRNLLADARVTERKYTLRVVDSNELNAYACGGHLVIVTTFAIDHLTPDQLGGVLAHELSHHIGMHTLALTVAEWLSIPVLFLARIGLFLQNVARAATDSFATNSMILELIGTIVAAILTIVSWVFLLGLYLSDGLGNLTGYGAEFAADARAVRLGYGRPLASALKVVLSVDGGRQIARGWRARLTNTHPPPRTRVARIEGKLPARTRRR